MTARKRGTETINGTDVNVTDRKTMTGCKPRMDPDSAKGKLANDMPLSKQMVVCDSVALNGDANPPPDLICNMWFGI